MTNMNDPQSQASVDVGGTKIAAGVVDSAGKTFSKLKLRTAKESRQKNFEQIAELGEEAALFGAARLAFPLPPRIGRWKRLI